MQHHRVILKQTNMYNIHMLHCLHERQFSKLAFQLNTENRTYLVTATKVYLVVPNDGFDAQRATLKISFQYKWQLREIPRIHTFNDRDIDKACNGKKFSKSTDRRLFQRTFEIQQSKYGITSSASCVHVQHVLTCTHQNKQKFSLSKAYLVMKLVLMYRYWSLLIIYLCYDKTFRARQSSLLS